MKRNYPVIDMLQTGQNIKHIMLAKGLSVRDVQRFLDFSTPQGIYHWFDGRTMPTLDNIYALSELFQMPVDSILCGNRRYTPVPFQDLLFGRMRTYCEKIAQMWAF